MTSRARGPPPIAALLRRRFSLTTFQEIENMNRAMLRTFLGATLLLALAALPAAGLTIPAGPDFWVTPPNSQTFLTFAAGDVESLCGATPSDDWDHKLVLRGVPTDGSDYDTVVARIDDATFTTSRTASTRIVVKHLAFESIAPQKTPCGELTWTAGLSGPQAVTKMKLTLTSQNAGFFVADIVVNVELQAFKSSGGYIGSLFYNILLPDPGTGTPWSISGGQFRAGMTPADDCIDVLRKKLAATDPNSSHFYFISDMIAAGKCTKR